MVVKDIGGWTAFCGKYAKKSILGGIQPNNGVQTGVDLTNSAALLDTMES
jgi:hypothetical protein